MEPRTSIEIALGYDHAHAGDKESPAPQPQEQLAGVPKQGRRKDQRTSEYKRACSHPIACAEESLIQLVWMTRKRAGDVPREKDCKGCGEQ